MAFAGMIFMFLGVTVIVLGSCLILGSLFLIIAFVMRSKAGKDLKYDEAGKAHISKWYLLPGGIGILFFLPLIITFAIVAYALVADSINNSKSL